MACWHDRYHHTHPPAARTLSLPCRPRYALMDPPRDCGCSSDYSCRPALHFRHHHHFPSRLPGGLRLSFPTIPRHLHGHPCFQEIGDGFGRTRCTKRMEPNQALEASSRPTRQGLRSGMGRLRRCLLVNKGEPYVARTGAYRSCECYGRVGPRPRSCSIYHHVRRRVSRRPPSSAGGYALEARRRMLRRYLRSTRKALGNVDRTYSGRVLSTFLRHTQDTPGS